MNHCPESPIDPTSPPARVLSADVVIAGAGAAGLAGAIAARDAGASVIVIEANDDVGGRAILSSGVVTLGGGTSLQRAHGIVDSADQIYLDHADPQVQALRYCDRDLLRVWADENAATFEFLLENGVRFIDARPSTFFPGSVPRLALTAMPSRDFRNTINGTRGAGLIRPLEASARAKGVTILLRHRLAHLVREWRDAGRVHAVVARTDDEHVRIDATRGVVIATGGHAANVNFRRMFDPRLTEEYQASGQPWTIDDADGPMLAMVIGASLWGTANQTAENGFTLSKTRHIGCQWGYRMLKWNPRSPVFSRARASGLTVRDFQDVILVNQRGVRFWNELDHTQQFIHACLGPNGNLGADGAANGGGPIWAIFDHEAIAREGWTPAPPHVDPDGWFFSAQTLPELASRIANRYQRWAIDGTTLERTVRTYNTYVELGRDLEFGRPQPKYRIQAPPFYAAWATPVVHDSVAGLRITPRCEVLDMHGRTIAGLYCAGEAAGGLAVHGLPRAVVFGRLAGRRAAWSGASTAACAPCLATASGNDSPY